MDSREVKESRKDKLDSVDDDSVPEASELCESHPTKEVDMSEEKSQEEMEEVPEEYEEDDSDEEEDVEEEDEEEEEEEEEEGEEDETEEPEEDEEDEEDEQEQKVNPGCANTSENGTHEIHAEVSLANNFTENVVSPIDGTQNSDYVNNKNIVCNVEGIVSGEVHGRATCENTNGFPIPEVSVKSDMKTDQGPENDENRLPRPEVEQEDGENMNAYDSPNSQDVIGKVMSKSHAGGVPPTARSSVLKVEYVKEELKLEPKMVEETMDDENRNQGSVCIFDTDTSGGGESGTDDEQAAFMLELEKFHKERSLEFKPPKFYGEPLNLLKLWRAVMKLGGYEKVTACKYWRQVGESFKPPKTCTTVSWTFRIFYEKALVEYERYRTSGDGPSVPTSLPVIMSVDNQPSGSGRARRDSAARAMQGWHSQRVLDNGEVSDPIIKDKNSNSLSKKEKQLKNLGLVKRKKPSTDVSVKVARTNVPKTQSETTVIDIGSPADWVKINVLETKDCYEVYALVPGLLREEVRVQSDPAGRLVISGEPENPDNPWNVTPFKKVVSLPSRIDPHQTSAVVTLHGQLFVRVPFEQYD